MTFLWASGAYDPAIAALWQAGFGEVHDPARIRDLLSRDGRCLLCCEDGEPVAMTYLLAATLGGRRWQYVYGLTTRPDRRGRGCAAALIGEAARRAAAKGCAGLLLHPAQESLFAYYARLGFVPAFYADRQAWQAKDLYDTAETVTWQKEDKTYPRLREQYLQTAGVPFVEWGSGVWAYALTCVGETAICPHGAAFFYTDGDRLVIEELLCEPLWRLPLAASLARENACQSVEVRTPPTKAGVPFGMALSFDKNLPPICGYMGFTL